MKPVYRYLLLISLLAFLLGVAWYISPSRQRASAHAYTASIQQDCAPWDGAAFSVKVPLENGDVIDIAIWEAPSIQFEKTFSFGEEPSQVGYASLAHAVDSGEQLTGTVSFAYVDLDQPVEGEFVLDTIGSRQHFAGQFHAEWLERTMLCG